MNKRKSTHSKGKKSVKRSHPRKSRSKHYRFGKSSCAYSVPYFGTMVPFISNTWSGTHDTGISSRAWAMPTPPGALAFDRQQGGWMKFKY